MKRWNSQGKRWICLGLLAVSGAMAQSRAQVNAPPVPKEKVVALTQASAGRLSRKPLDWVMPAGWKELPGDSMRVATFSLAGQGARQAQVTIVPIGGGAGTMLENENRWRSQLGQGPLEPAAVSNQLATVEVGGAHAQLVEVAGALASGQKSRPARMLVAVLNRDDTTWFFKLLGDDSLVAEQKPAFLQFLKSVSFSKDVVAVRHEVTVPPGSGGMDFARIHQGMKPGGDGAAYPVAEATRHPAWQVPTNWQPVAASPMLAAKFQTSGPGNARAEINVSVGPGLAGGAAANINRWRGQLGLGPVDQAGLGRLIAPVDVAGGKAMLVDMAGPDLDSGEDRRLVALIVPVVDQTWFFKLFGSADLVAREKASLIQFVQSARFAYAH